MYTQRIINLIEKVYKYNPLIINIIASAFK